METKKTAPQGQKDGASDKTIDNTIKITENDIHNLLSNYVEYVDNAVPKQLHYFLLFTCLLLSVLNLTLYIDLKSSSKTRTYSNLVSNFFVSLSIYYDLVCSIEKYIKCKSIAKDMHKTHMIENPFNIYIILFSIISAFTFAATEYVALPSDQNEATKYIKPTIVLITNAVMFAEGLITIYQYFSKARRLIIDKINEENNTSKIAQYSGCLGVIIGNIAVSGYTLSALVVIKNSDNKYMQGTLIGVSACSIIAFSGLIANYSYKPFVLIAQLLGKLKGIDRNTCNKIMEEIKPTLISLTCISIAYMSTDPAQNAARTVAGNFPSLSFMEENSFQTLIVIGNITFNSTNMISISLNVLELTKKENKGHVNGASEALVKHDKEDKRVLDPEILHKVRIFLSPRAAEAVVAEETADTSGPGIL